MGPIDPTRIEACLRLSQGAGWNQLADDWRIFLDHGVVLGIDDDAGTLIATGAVLPYDGFAWISMVLVDGTRRRQGLGTRILEGCLAETTRLGLVSVLDATEAGEPLYRGLGFGPLFRLTRWIGQGTAGLGGAGNRLRPAEEGDLVLDVPVFGSPRGFVLDGLKARAPRISGGDRGFVLGRPGRTATQIGPVVAEDEAAAAALIEHGLAGAEGPVLIDLVDGRPALEKLLTDRGFTVQRRFLRMARGRDIPYGDPSRLFAAAGPELG